MSNISDEEIEKLATNFHVHFGYIYDQREKKIKPKEIVEWFIKNCINFSHQNKVSDEEAKTPIQDALYATGKFTTDDCDMLSEGILQYIKDTKLNIVRQEYASIVNERDNVVNDWISVEDSKPTNDSLLLTASGICIIGDWYKEGWRTNKSHWEMDADGINKLVSAYKDESITHWMPLPKPPIESQSK